ncbi:unnamed protein product [Colias eurytheme]|nr:unnamed protein product [Colias eurytheme]
MIEHISTFLYNIILNCKVINNLYFSAVAHFKRRRDLIESASHPFAAKEPIVEVDSSETAILSSFVYDPDVSSRLQRP